MAKYKAYALVTGTKYLGEVEADTKEEAMNKAFDLESMEVSLCYQCDTECEDPTIEEIILEEVDVKKVKKRFPNEA